MSVGVEYTASQDRANVIFNSFGADAINCILKHLRVNSGDSGFQKCENLQCRCQANTHVVYHKSDFFQARLVSKKWNRAAQMCISQWAGLLESRGPRQITKDSKHRDIYSHTGVCKHNLTGMCTVSAHYSYYELQTKYKKEDNLSLYKESIKFLGKKFKSRMKSVITRGQKELYRNKKMLSTLQRQITYRDNELKRLEKDFEIFDEHYQPFLKRRKKTAKGAKGAKK
jgi:hypothetical protein